MAAHMADSLWPRAICGHWPALSLRDGHEQRGRVGDLTSDLIRLIVDKQLATDHEAYQVGCEITDTPALFMTIPEAERWPMTADSARPETISHMRSHGFPKIYSAVKGPKSVEEGVEWLKSCDIIVHPRCQHVIDELTMYSFKTDPMTGRVLSELDDKHNHVIDALRYANEGVRRAAKVNTSPPVTMLPIEHHWRR